MKYVMDLQQYMDLVSERGNTTLRQRRNEFWEVLGALLVAVLAATPWSFLMAVLAVKVVTG